MQDNPSFSRTIKTFSRRQSRLTEGQKSALENFMGKHGLTPNTVETFLSSQPEQKVTILEIGFGNGDSLVEQASNFPDQHFIGIEVYDAGIGHCLAEIEKNKLNNLKLMQADAVEILTDNFLDNCLDRVQIFFPDPWHKNRHHKRRLVQKDFVSLLIKKLKVGGEIHFATDWMPYAKHAEEVLTDNAALTSVRNDETIFERPDYRPETKFERRGIRLGHQVCDLIFRRVC